MISSLIAVFGMLHRVGSLGCGWRLTHRPLHPRGYHVAAAAAAATPATPTALSSKLKMPPIVTADGDIKPMLDIAEYRQLEELASRVVNGSATRAVPSGTQLRRRRSWELFLGEPECCPGAAVLVVNKKSPVTLDDARAALSIISDEAAARHPGGEAPGLKHMLLTTRADVAPVADAFLRGAPSTPSSKAGRATTMRWEQLESLVRDGDLGRYLATSAGPRSDKVGLPKPPSLTLPDWLIEERKRGASARFDLQSPFEPSGDQPEAIEALARGLEEGKRYQTLLGATGTGKTFIVANVIQKASLPTLVLAPNKVLASQLTNELRALFPNNAVEFFVSYYDYFMPEAFVSSSDTYIDKVVQINDDIDRMRHSATRSLLERRDVIVVASVSCIYGLGMPSKYFEASMRIVVGQAWTGGWRTLAQHLEQDLFYSPLHNETDFKASPRGNLRIVCDGDGVNVIEIGPAADEAVVSVVIDEAGIVRKIKVAPTDGGTEGHLLQSEEGEVRRSLPSLVAARGAGDVDGDGPSLTPPMGSERTSDVKAYVIYPARHHVVGSGEMDHVLAAISAEMEEWCCHLGREGRVLEAERLRQRTENDLLLLSTVGTCKGVENYSRHLAGRGPGDPPETLVDYFPENDWLLIVDESHVSAPQLGAMWGGDRARKSKLVEHGFRLPSALDNRPLKAGEFWSKVNRSIFVSATPGKFELELSTPRHGEDESAVRGRNSPRKEALDVDEAASSADHSSPHPPLSTPGSGRAGKSDRLGWDEIGDLVDAQAVIRPTGITDPPIDIRPSEGQVADLVQECKARGGRGERVLVTALTKRMAEDLCAFLVEQGVPTAYLHSDVKPMHRLELLRQLRTGEIDVIVGVNLLREGLNLPEVSLVCVLDADAEGFLRSDTALLQTIGRATRHRAGRAVLYADRVTPSMHRALAETDRRRCIQTRHNKLHGITPSVAKAASVGDSILESINMNDATTQGEGIDEGVGIRDPSDLSWAGHALPPDQVQLLYDLATRKGGGAAGGRSSPLLSASPSVAPVNGEAGEARGTQVPLFVANDDTSRALKRLADQASEKMLLSAKKTDFKEAALWRDRRDALLSTLRQLEAERDDVQEVEKESSESCRS